jgi:hypothetical protein
MAEPIPLELPPGMLANGTALQSRGRWRDGNLIRWQEGALLPQGGWERRKKDGVDLTVLGTPRAAYIWRDNQNIIHLAIGSDTKLFTFENASDKQNITPVDFVTGSGSGSVADGYGIGDYNEETYGTPRTVDQDYATDIPATMWTFSNWGENLIGHTLNDGRLFEWQPGSGPAVPIVNAPVNNRSFVVTNERIVMALGADGLPRLVRWSDQENNTSWAPDPLNQAGDITLQTNGTIITGRTTPDGVLIWTSEDLWVASYSGYPYIYSFRALAGKTTLVSRGAMAVIDSRVVWMGLSGFFIYDGYMNPLPCDVQDRVFNYLNVPQLSKVWALVNHGMFEVVWFYPSQASNDIDSYVTWNYKENYWITGQVARTCGVPAGILPNPILVTKDGHLYNHGVGFDYEGLVPFVESWPIELSEGGREMMVKKLIPDELVLGDVNVTFKARQYPTTPERVKTYTLANPTNTRVAGRQVAIRFEGVRPTQWRIGRMRVEVTQLGGR